MSYRLTLTADERAAFDWVGDRYCAGCVARLLITKCHCAPEEAQWDQGVDITFTVPEPVAWQIRDLAEDEDFLWPCFARALASKLNDFCGNIV